MRTTTEILDHVRSGGFNMLTEEEIARLSPSCQDASFAGHRREPLAATAFQTALTPGGAALLVAALQGGAVRS